jgi:hypothetical protein
LEDDYVAKRQYVGLKELERLHTEMADEALVSHVQDIRIACEKVGGVFGKRISSQLDAFFSTISK